MKRWGTVLAALAVTLLMAVPAQGQTDGEYAELDAYLQGQQQATTAPAMAAAVTDGDEVVFARGYGQANADTPFYVGSLSKAITATAVLTLVEEGAIDLDEPVQTYLPDFSLADESIAASVTVRQVLNQVSGLNDTSFADLRNPAPDSLAADVERLAGAEPVAQPGEEFYYYNMNYVVAGRLVEAASGQPFEAYVQAAILEPLGMASSSYTAGPGVPPGYNVALGFPFRAGNTVPTSPASGGLISTAPDMARFIAIYLNEGAPLLSPELAAEALTPPEAPAETPYAMGWFEAEYAGVPVVWHSGDLSNFHADMVIIPEEGVGAVLLYNMNNLLALVGPINSTRVGVVTQLAEGEALGGGLSMRAIGLIVLAVAVFTLYDNIRKLLTAKQWAAEQRDKAFPATVLGFFFSLLPLLIFIAIPIISAVGGGRVVSYGLLFSYLPDVMVVLVLGIILGIAQVGLRAYWLRADAASV